MFLHKVVQNGESHVRTNGTCTIPQQQGGVHHFANLATLHDESRLHTLADGNQIVMDSRNSQ